MTSSLLSYSCNDCRNRGSLICSSCVSDSNRFAKPSMFREGKPPLGLTPRYIVDERRAQEIREAIIRYLEAGKPVSPEWLAEYNALIIKYKGER